MAWQTSRKGTSFVRVCPWRTLGSARVAVEEEVHGVGMPKGSSAASGSGCVEAAEPFLLRKRLKSPWLEIVSVTCGLNLCLFSSLDVLPSSLEEDLGSPSQTSISMHLHPLERTLNRPRVRSYKSGRRIHTTKVQCFAFPSWERDVHSCRRQYLTGYRSGCLLGKCCGCC